MTYPTAYLSDEHGAFGEQIGNIWQNWRAPAFWTASFKRQITREASDLALLTPSLVAEAAPLYLFWDAHLPVWEMSVMMAAAFAFTSWLTWVAVAIIQAARR